MFEEVKKLGRHYMIYACGTIMSRAIGFLMIPVYTRYLTPQDYGIIELLDISFTILSFILIEGIGMAVFKIYFDYDKEERKEVISTALIFNIIVVITLIGILYQFTENLSSVFFGVSKYAYFFKIILLTFITEVFLSVPLIYIRAEEKSAFFTGFAIFRLIIGLCLNIYFVAILRIGVEGVLYSALISGGAGCAIVIPLTIKAVGIRFSFNKLKKMLCYGLPVIPASFCTFIIGFADRFFLRYFSGLHNLGLYALSCKFGLVIHIVLTSPFILGWHGFIFPVGKKENSQQIFSRVLTYFTLILISGGLGISVLIKDVLKSVATPAFFDAYKVVPLIVLGYIFFGITYVLQAGIYLKSKTKWLPFINGIGAVVNLFLNWLLVSRYGTLGAALTNCVTYFSIALITYFVSNRYFYIPYEFNRILKMVLLGISIYFLVGLITISSVFYSILLKGMIAISFPALLFLFNFYYPDEKKKIGELVTRGYSNFQFRHREPRMDTNKHK